MTALKKESCPLEIRTTVFVKQYTTPRTCHTRKLFRVWLKRSSRLAVCILCVISQNSHPHRHVSCRTRNVHGLTATPLLYRTALRLQSVLRTGVSPAIRNTKSRVVVLPNRARFKGYEPTVPSSEQHGGYDCARTLEKSRHWFDLQLWRGHRYDPCFVGDG